MRQMELEGVSHAESTSTNPGEESTIAYHAHRQRILTTERDRPNVVSVFFFTTTCKDLTMFPHGICSEYPSPWKNPIRNCSNTEVMMFFNIYVSVCSTVGECAPGYQPNVNSIGTCEQCPVNYFKPNAGFASCERCSDGSHTNGQTGRTSCGEYRVKSVT